MIKDFHIHIYFEEQTIQLAKDLITEIQERFSVEIGTFHEKNVGPHPRWSVQVLVSSKIFGEVLSYVALNRKQLTIFSHPNTGNDLLDHTERAIWMGEIFKLNTDIFNN